MRSRTIRHTFKSPSQSTLWVAQMNERNYCYEAAGVLNNGFPDDAPQVLQSIAGKLNQALGNHPGAKEKP